MKKRRSFTEQLVASVVVLVLGIILIINPGGMLKLVSLLLGIFLLIAGVVILIKLIADDTKKERTVLNIIYSITSIIGGIVLLSTPTIMAKIMVIIFALLIIISSIRKVITVVSNKDSSGDKWKLGLALSLITLVLGVVFLIYSFQVAETFTAIVGIVICLYAVIDLFNVVIINKQVAEKETHENELIKEIEVVEKENEEIVKDVDFEEATPKKKKTSKVKKLQK